MIEVLTERAVWRNEWIEKCRKIISKKMRQMGSNRWSFICNETTPLNGTFTVIFENRNGICEVITVKIGKKAIWNEYIRFAYSYEKNLLYK